MGLAKAKAADRLKQFAALPWRDQGQGPEVLLISSRGTRRWVIPKGWPIRGLTPHASAAREAFEEAGIGGIITKKVLGRYSYDKLDEDGRAVLCEVEVYPLEVIIQHREWPEQGQREMRWMTPEAAADVVQEAGLARLIRRLR